MARSRPSWHLVVLCFAAASLSLTAFQSQASGAQAETEWTVMVYMAADSEPALPWEEDINEMEEAHLTDRMNVVVLVDPLGSGDSMILDIVSDESPNIVSTELNDSLEVIPADGEVDMTSPGTLSDFVTFCWRNYPADRLVLVLWGHSGGWYGLCQDGTSLLQLPDLRLALEDATLEMGRRVDIVVADSCVEGVLETMYELRDYADWYVGSEIAVPAQGLRYDQILDSLAEDTDVTPEEWGAVICETHRTNLLLNSWSAAMAVYDLRALDEFIGRLSELSSYMEGYADLYRDDFSRTLEETASSDFSEWYLDVGDALLGLASTGVPPEVNHLALQALIAYNDLLYVFESYASPYDDGYDHVLNYTGAAVYAPAEAELGASYQSLSFYGTRWGNATAAIRNGEPETVTDTEFDMSIADTDDDGELDQATLHWGTTDERHVAWVFVRTGAGLELLDVLESEGPDIVIAGLAGDLTVSASAWDGGVVVAHHMTELTLTRALDIRVRVVSGDAAVTDGVDVVVHGRAGEIHLTLSGEEFVGDITVPDDAWYGDLLTVEVLDTGGTTVALNRTYVTDSDIVLEVVYFTDAEDTPGMEFVLPAAALVISAIAVAIYIRGRRHGHEP